MAKKRDIPIRRDPRLAGDLGLIFDNDVTRPLSDEEKSEKFLSKYMEVVDPVVKFEKYFLSSGYTIQSFFKRVKTDYIRLVVNGNWEEKRFVAVVNDICENNRPYSQVSLDICSKLYDSGRLSSQQRAKNRRNRGRI